jgi:2-amino-4-hydroxy-6-hydroxymethyldihydropteridine diphosphokinase
MTLPAWAKVTPERQAHIERVAALLARWADERGVTPEERSRWIRAAYLHDALRDASLGGGSPLAHGPAAADRAEREGERDRGVLDAVRFHTTGYAGWDDVGRMLYLADYLEPGREVDREERARLARRAPYEPEGVLVEVAKRKIGWLLLSSRPIDPGTVDFWNALVAR